MPNVPIDAIKSAVYVPAIFILPEIVVPAIVRPSGKVGLVNTTGSLLRVLQVSIVRMSRASVVDPENVPPGAGDIIVIGEIIAQCTGSDVDVLLLAVKVTE